LENPNKDHDHDQDKERNEPDEAKIYAHQLIEKHVHAASEKHVLHEYHEVHVVQEKHKESVV
jgi:hypothetical protein